MVRRNFFEKKFAKSLASSKNSSNFAPLKRNNGPLAQLNRAFDYGSKGYRFESCRDHNRGRQSIVNQLIGFLFYRVLHKICTTPLEISIFPLGFCGSFCGFSYLCNAPENPGVTQVLI